MRKRPQARDERAGEHAIRAEQARSKLRPGPRPDAQGQRTPGRWRGRGRRLLAARHEGAPPRADGGKVDGGGDHLHFCERELRTAAGRARAGGEASERRHPTLQVRRWGRGEAIDRDAGGRVCSVNLSALTDDLTVGADESATVVVETPAVAPNLVCVHVDSAPGREPQGLRASSDQGLRGGDAALGRLLTPAGGV